MKILVVGGGGREHALVWALARGGDEVVCAPGNGGIARIARCVPADVTDVASTMAVVEAEAPALVVIGPEVPLAAGLADACGARGAACFGPSAAAARLETSKAFAKEFMQRWGIPTAGYRVCSDMGRVRAALTELGGLAVVKADGLAGGKGVVVCSDAAEAEAAAEALFAGGAYGPPAVSLVVEERLEGPEVSFFAVCDGTRAVPLAAAQDHKRLGEGDTGPNTGGMGAYSTPGLLSGELWDTCAGIAGRVVEGMQAEGTPFAGVLFIGLMLTASGPRVLEFNTRFGDPETEVLVLRLETPLAQILAAAAAGDLSGVSVRVSDRSAACVVVASGGYPGAYRTGVPVSLPAKLPEGVQVFHAGTALSNGGLVTAGGRVLVVAGVGQTLGEALGRVYGVLEMTRFEDMVFRRDIGWQALGAGARR